MEGESRGKRKVGKGKTRTAEGSESRQRLTLQSEQSWHQGLCWREGQVEKLGKKKGKKGEG